MKCQSVLFDDGRMYINLRRFVRSASDIFTALLSPSFARQINFYCVRTIDERKERSSGSPSLCVMCSWCRLVDNQPTQWITTCSVDVRTTVTEDNANEFFHLPAIGDCHRTKRPCSTCDWTTSAGHDKNFAPPTDDCAIWCCNLMLLPDNRNTGRPVDALPSPLSSTHLELLTYYWLLHIFRSFWHKGRGVEMRWCYFFVLFYCRCSDTHFDMIATLLEH